GEGFNYSISIANDSQRFILVSKGNESGAKNVYSFEKSLAQYETGYLGMAYYTGNPAGLYVNSTKNSTPVIVGEPPPVCLTLAGIDIFCIYFKTFTVEINFTIPGNKVFGILYFDVERHKRMKVEVNGQTAYDIDISDPDYWRLFVFDYISKKKEFRVSYSLDITDEINSNSPNNAKIIVAPLWKITFLGIPIITFNLSNVEPKRAEVISVDSRGINVDCETYKFSKTSDYQSYNFYIDPNKEVIFAYLCLPASPNYVNVPQSGGTSAEIENTDDHVTTYQFHSGHDDQFMGAFLLDVTKALNKSGVNYRLTIEEQSGYSGSTPWWESPRFVYVTVPKGKYKLIETFPLNYNTTAYDSGGNFIYDEGGNVHGESRTPSHLLYGRLNFTLGKNITQEARLTNVWVIFNPDEDSIDANYSILDENGSLVYSENATNYNYPRLISLPPRSIPRGNYTVVYNFSNSRGDCNASEFDNSTLKTLECTGLYSNLEDDPRLFEEDTLKWDKCILYWHWWGPECKNKRNDLRNCSPFCCLGAKRLDEYENDINEFDHIQVTGTIIATYEITKVGYSGATSDDEEIAKRLAIEKLLIDLDYDYDNDSSISGAELTDAVNISKILAANWSTWPNPAPDDWITNKEDFWIDYENSEIKALAIPGAVRGAEKARLVFKIWREE
ncbi:MAG: hypothetical protein DRN25_06750, partial [Thermoplasmata archaeon]